MKNSFLPSTIFLYLAWLLLSPTAVVGQSCDCQEYLYLNDVGTGEVHKFAVDPISGVLTEIGSPWMSGFDSPHGLGFDENGFLYIGNDPSSGPIYKVDCDGGTRDGDGEIWNTSITGGGLTNIGSLGNFIFTNGALNGTDFDKIQVLDACSGELVGQICLNGTDGRDWGLQVLPDGTILVSSGLNLGFGTPPRVIWRFTFDESQLDGACIDPLVSSAESPAGDYLDAYEEIYGVTTDGTFIYFIARDASQATFLVKIDATTGALVQSVAEGGLDGSGYSGARGLVYSPSADLLYVAGFEECISVVDPSDLTYLGAGNTTPVPPGSEPKAIAIVTECCPTQDAAFSRAICADPNTETVVFLRDYFSCPDGVVCEGQWAEVSDPNDLFTYRACDNSVTVVPAAVGCGTYTLTTGAGNNAQCGAFTITVEICVEDPSATVGTTPPSCPDGTPAADAQVNLTGISGNRVGISTAGAAAYDGPDYATAIDLVGADAYDFTGLTENATYIVRVFSGADDCITDYTATTAPANCGPRCGEPTLGPDQPACAGTTGCLGGSAFEDFNCNGTVDAEPGVGGVIVNVYDCDNNLVGSTTTDAEGDWELCTGVTDGAQYRVEFILPAEIDCWANPTHVGGDSGSDVQFVTAPACANFSLSSPLDYCQEDPFVFIPCYINGNNTGTEEVLIGVPYSSTGENPVGKYIISEANQMATTWGLAYNNTEEVLYASAMLKRHVGLSAAGLDAIFVADPFSGTTNASVWLEVQDDLGVDVGQSLVSDNATRGLNMIVNYDVDAYSLVGTVGIGDIDLNEDNSILYAVNIFEGTVLEIDVATMTLLNTYPVPNPGCTGGNFRVWALNYHRGSLYVGGVCDAFTSQDAADLSATVYRLNGGTFSQVLSFPLDYTKDPAAISGSCDQNTGWYPWTNDVPANCATTGGGGLIVVYPQPIFTDIEFDDNNNMVLGFGDRAGLQWGTLNYPPDPNMNSTARYVVRGGGDILHACFDPTVASWQIENSSTSCTNTAGTALPDGEFYTGDFFTNNGNFPHQETSLGSLATLKGTGEVLVAVYDPVNGGLDNFSTGGFRTLSNTTGDLTREGTRIYEQGGGTQAKGWGLGDVELGCDPAPLEIGNYVWCDDNANGIQDACEAGVDGIVVQLYDRNDMLVGVTTTVNGGQYYFNQTNVDTTGVSADGLTPTSGMFTGMSYNTDYTIVFGDGQFGAGMFTVGPDSYGITGVVDANGNANDNIDSDVDGSALNVSGLPFIALTTDALGCANHSYDLGLDCSIEPISVSLGSTVFEDLDNSGEQDAGEAGIAGVLVVPYLDGGDLLTDGVDDTPIVTGADGIVGTTDDAFGPDGISGTADDGLAGVLTDANGDYFFAGLEPGDYYVRIPADAFALDAPLDNIPISSNTSSGTFAGETDPDDNADGDDDGLQTGTGTVTTSQLITLAAGEEPTDLTTETAQGNLQDNPANGYVDENGNMTLDLGFFAPVSLGDTAFVDLNGNGLQDADDPGIAGVIVTLLDENGDPVTVDAEGNPITGMDTTDATGFYEFLNLPPGVYSVRFDYSEADNAEFYVFTTPDAGDDALDSDNSLIISDSVAQSDPTDFLPSGQRDSTLDVGLVCNVSVTLADPFTICATATIDLTQEVTITPDTSVTFGATWTTADGTGDFLNEAGDVLAEPFRFGEAVQYDPSPADAQRGSVTLILTTDDPEGPCEPVSAQVTIQILKVDCGEFFWDGNE